MYSRCLCLTNLVCVLFDPAIPTSSFNFIVFYTCNNMGQPTAEELSKLVQRGILVSAEPHRPRFYSHTFTIPKKTGEQRLIINLKGLNHYILHVHFKMENIQQLQDILLPNDWMVKTGLLFSTHSPQITGSPQDLVEG